MWRKVSALRARLSRSEPAAAFVSHASLNVSNKLNSAESFEPLHQSRLGNETSSWRPGKVSTAEEHGKRIRVLGTTHRELLYERTLWSERRFDVGRGKENRQR